MHGHTNCFGVMPDWNPAEIIGIKPKPLALSLYKGLITDHIWAKNRWEYGFRNLESHHLMTTFYGTPYIDVRVDFNSWVPKDLDEKVAMLHLAKLGVELETLRQDQAEYIGVEVAGPFKPEYYRY